MIDKHSSAATALGHGLQRQLRAVRGLGLGLPDLWFERVGTFKKEETRAATS